jgi:hypothetical protein
MKTLMTVILVGSLSAGVSASAAARDGVSFRVVIGAPPIAYVAPAPVYYYPPPQAVYYAPQVYYAPPVYYTPAPWGVRVGPSYYAGWNRHHRH